MNWTVFDPSNSPIPGFSVLSLTSDRYGNLWIGAAGGLAVYNSNGIIGIQKNNITLPKSFILKQNFPNPFNPDTKIQYELKTNSTVNLAIFDISGKIVTTLINKKQSSGKYNVIFNALNYPSGIYFYKLETENENETKKMILLK